MDLVFLMVIHTHDLIDAFFFLVSRALVNDDCLSISELFSILKKRLAHPPMATHFQDQSDFMSRGPDH